MWDKRSKDSDKKELEEKSSTLIIKFQVHCFDFI
jgi:hypothetical protein